VAAGSLVMHLLLLLGVWNLDAQIASVSSTSDSVPVELIEIAPESAGSIETTGTATSQPSGDPGSSSLVSPNTVSPAIEAEPAPSTIVEPRSSLSAPTLTQAPAQPTASAEWSRPPDPVTPIPTAAPTPIPEQVSSTDAVNGTSPPLQPAEPDPFAGMENPEPLQPEPQPSLDSGESGELLQDLVVRQQIAPARIVASVTSAQPGIQDIQDQPAQPKFDTSPVITLDPTEYGCAVLDAEGFRYLGQAVEFQVVIATVSPELGVISAPPTLRSGSGSETYDQVAACLLQEWEFYPAVTAGESPELSELIVRVRIDAAD
jgi:hypothetical protein